MMVAAAFAGVDTASAPAQSMVLNLMPMFIIFGIFYFLIIRPQQRKQQEHEQMLKSLKKYDEIVTSGGVHGTIVNVKDTTVSVKVDDEVKLEIEKSAVASVTKKAAA